MINNYVYSEEGRVKRASRHAFILILLGSLFLGVAAAYAASQYLVYSSLTPYQRLYYPQFRQSFFRQYTSFKKQARYILLTRTTVDPKTKKPVELLWLENQIVFALDEEGKIKFDERRQPLVSVRQGVSVDPGKSSFEPMERPHGVVYKVLKDAVYQSEFYELFYLPAGIGLVSFVFFSGAGFSLHSKSIRGRLKGVFKRGMRLYSAREYERLMKHADGFSVAVSEPGDSGGLLPRLRQMAKSVFVDNAHVCELKISHDEESKGTLILGDSGTGKSLLLHQIISCARSTERQEPGVCYDPAAEFVQSHYQEGRDFILNPFDERFPNWELSDEIKTVADLDLIAESFFPSRFIRDSQTKFFNRAAQDVFKQILSKKTTNREIVRIIGDPAAIDEAVKGTEVAHKIDPKAGPQRAGVLASLADAGKVLRTIPPAQEGKKRFSFTGWANGDVRHGWLFLTMTADTRDSLRPLVSAMLNILMRRLMSVPPERRRNDAWWFVADELHTLNSLSALPEFVAECRKHGVRYVIGTQSKHQLLPQYGEEARAILAQPKLKIFYRCNEAEAATWVSQNIGSGEFNRTQVSTSLPTGSEGRESVNFQNVTENRVLFTKEQIMSLPDLHGVWKFGDAAVPFKLQYIKRKSRHPHFAPRPLQPTVQPKPTAGSKKDAQISVVNNQTAAGTDDFNAKVNTPLSDKTETLSAPAGGETIKPPHEEPRREFSNEIRLDF